MQSVILCNISDAVSVVNEARHDWIIGVLDALNVQKDIYNSQNIDRYREKMEELGVEVELSTAGDVNIYKKTWREGRVPEESGWLPATENNLIAQWKEPTYTKRIDGKETYYEIGLNEWSSVKKKTNE